MSFGTSDTYIYTYVVFACVYLVASLTFVANALRVSTGLSRAHETAMVADPAAVQEVTEVLGHGRKLVDYTQLATLLPLVYIVGSMFLGTVVMNDTALARTVNVGWIAFTALCALASIVLAFLGVRAAGAIGRTSDLPKELPGQAPEALQRVGLRLGVSAALLLLVAVFTMLNLWSVVDSLGVLEGVDFLL